MRLTSDSLVKAFDIPLSLANMWYAPLMDAVHSYRLTNEKEILYLVAQMAYETGLFKRTRENLNYTSPERILIVFGKHIAPHEAEDFVRHPVKLANRVYANRLGNGNEESGDGYRFRGGGGLMLTGKANYRKYGQSCGFDLVHAPQLIEQLDHACHSALWFWTTNDLGRFALVGDIRTMTKRIVGSAESADKRNALFVKLLEAIK